MSGLEDFSPVDAIEVIRQRYAERLAAQKLPQEDQAHLLDFMVKLAEVAAQLILQQKVIEIPEGSTQEPLPFDSVPFDGTTAVQTMDLFCEGLYSSMIKSWEMGVPQELQAQLLQNVAQHVFENAKQVVLSVYGQELTPEFQISRDQQVDMVNQTSESALLYYISEYEKAYGPYEPVQRVLETIEQEAPPLEQVLAEEPEVPAPEPAVAEGVPERAHHAKYAALALILTTLNKHQQAKILSQFTAEEQEVMNYYASPENIERALDVNAVANHLQTLKDQIRASLPVQERSPANRAIEEMANQYPKEILLSYVRGERPLIQNYLETFFAEHEESASADTALEPELHVAASPAGLPPKIESVLHRYLSRQVS